MSGTSQKFVCVMNRNRDGYQVPLALYERGLLDRLVTDFYAGEPGRLMPAAMAGRRIDGLPHSMTRNSWSSFLVQSAAQVARLPMRAAFAVSDRLLAFSAATVAWRGHAALYSYAGYMPPERLIRRGVRRIVFEYHPLPGAARAMLRADAALYPEVAWSFANEAESRDEAAPPARDWRRADAVVCASSMTQRSLVEDGCDPARITVIPYGFDDAVASGMTAPAATASSSDRCRFLFVGQGVQRKGLHHLIRAWRAASLQQAELTLVCARIDPGIESMIEGSGIRLLRRQSAGELDALYRQADVFVLPSLVEGFGLVYLEALARGCLVIGTHNTGLPDLPIGDGARILVPAGDLDRLGDAMESARDRWAAGTLDRGAIRAMAGTWQWRDFRRAIADHAQGVIG